MARCPCTSRSPGSTPADGLPDLCKRTASRMTRSPSSLCQSQDGDNWQIGCKRVKANVLNALNHLWLQDELKVLSQWCARSRGRPRACTFRCSLGKGAASTSLGASRHSSAWTGGLREVPQQHGVGVRVCCDAVASLDLRRVLCRSESDRAHTRPQTSHISLGRVSRASRSLTLSHSQLCVRESERDVSEE